LEKIALANAGRWGWCYTHKPWTEANLRCIQQANTLGFCVNLSAEGWKRADAAAELGVAPVFTVLPHTLVDPGWKRSYTTAGRLIVRCPAERGKHTCMTCGGGFGPLCARIDRDFIVGVSTHGIYRNRLASIIAEMEMFG
jgi:hypothetical protein